MCLVGRIGVYDGRDTFFEGVQAGRLDHGLWELIPLGESALTIVHLLYIYTFLYSIYLQ